MMGERGRHVGSRPDWSVGWSRNARGSAFQTEDRDNLRTLITNSLVCNSTSVVLLGSRAFISSPVVAELVNVRCFKG